MKDSKEGKKGREEERKKLKVEREEEIKKGILRKMYKKRRGER